MLLWVVVIAWLIVVIGGLAVVGVRTAAVAKRARVVQGQLQEQVVALEAGGLTTLAERTVVLQQRMEQLQIAFERLNRSLQGLRILLEAWNGAIRPLRFLLRFLRR